MGPISKVFKSATVVAARKAVALGVFVGALSSGALALAQDPKLAGWTFESTAPVTAGPFSPETGAGSATGFHAASTVYSSPVGNASSHSFSSNGWSVGDYYQFHVSTTGFQDITISWDQTGSNTGPANYALEYSTNGTSFTTVDSYSVTNDTWSSTGTPKAASERAFDFSSIAAIDNQPAVYFRLVDTSTTAISGSLGTAGTDRVDNVVINGTVVATPEPSSFALAAIGILGMALAAIRRIRR